MKKTFSLKQADVSRQWIIVDAASAPLGRVATFIATQLSGKHKPTFTPHIDDGNFVVVINSDSVKVTGNKTEAKEYHRYTGYPSGLRTRSMKEQMNLDSTRVVEDAVYGMLPKNKLRADRMKRLKVYPNTEHPHAPQQPVTMEIPR